MLMITIEVQKKLRVPVAVRCIVIIIAIFLIKADVVSPLYQRFECSFLQEITKIGTDDLC